MCEKCESLDHLTGIRGLWIFLNHPMREPKLEDCPKLKPVYQRLFIEADDETRNFDPHEMEEFIAMKEENREIKHKMASLETARNLGKERRLNVETENKRLKAYAEHKSFCKLYHGGDKCTCGLEELLNKGIDG